MALFFAVCTDRPGGLDIRNANRPAHLEFLKTVAGQIKLGGPFLDDKGDMAGSMLVVEAEDRAAAEALLAQDPYRKADLFQSVELRAWRWSVGNPQS